jgi:competence protein ComEA
MGAEQQPHGDKEAFPMKLLKAAFLALTLLSFGAMAGDVDINSADAKTLAKNLHGVGPKIAEAIVAYRSAHGPFKTAEDLLKVKGFGDKTLAKNRERIVVGARSK